MRFALSLVGLLLLAGCATTSPSATVPINLPDLPPSILAPCPGPVTLPSADTGRQDVERYWATDRTNLRKCANRQSGLVTSYQTLKSNLAGAKR